MKNQFSNFIEFLKTPFQYFFLALSHLISIFLVTSVSFAENTKSKVKKNRLSNKTFKNDKPEFNELYFSACHTKYDTSLDEAVYLILQIVGLLLILPAVIATYLFTLGLQIDYPNMSLETLELLTVFAFIYFKANYWLLLSYFIHSLHDKNLLKRSPPKPILSIMPK